MHKRTQTLKSACSVASEDLKFKEWLQLKKAHYSITNVDAKHAIKIAPNRKFADSKKENIAWSKRESYNISRLVTTKMPHEEPEKTRGGSHIITSLLFDNFEARKFPRQKKKHVWNRNLQAYEKEHQQLKNLKEYLHRRNTVN